jgi:hypothetical protein
MTRVTLALVVLVAVAAYAGPAKWVEIGKTPEGWPIAVAPNKKELTGSDTFTIPLCIDNAQRKRDCSTVNVDCETWTLDGLVVGPRTVGDLILKSVCPKD